MSGLLFILFAGIWIAIVGVLVRALGKRYPASRGRTIAQIAVVVVMGSLPFLDELIGGLQFSSLCKNNNVRTSPAGSNGRVVILNIGPQVEVPGTWLKVTRLPFRYLDSSTGQEVASFDQLNAAGGRLMPGSAAGHEPILFNGECHPDDSFENGFPERYGMKLVKRKS